MNLFQTDELVGEAENTLTGEPTAEAAIRENRPLLRFLTCGSVDDGKSTLIGRLLFETGRVFSDEFARVRHASRKNGAADDEPDLALLVDGLEAEREQGITIDVAYRYFATDKRKFIVADTPGHEQYTRNMATGASTSDLAVVLVDARTGVLQQTRRHCFIASLLGIRHILLAVNKIDLVGFRREAFDAIVADFRGFADRLNFLSVASVPISARHGHNITTRSSETPWHTGPTLLEHLESVDVAASVAGRPFRLPIQYVNRPNQSFRGYCGTVASGVLRKGDAVVEAKTGKSSRVKAILGVGGDQIQAVEGQAVTLTLEDEIEASRGNFFVSPDRRPYVADQFAAKIIWFDEPPLLPGRSYILRTETDQAGATITELKHRINVTSFAHEAAKSLDMNEVGVCNLSTQAPVVFDAYAENKATGAFVLINRMTNHTAGAGMILHPLRRASNLRWQTLDVDRSARAAMKHQKPFVMWFTGLSGSGKSTIVNLVEKRLHALNRHTCVLDGDNVRHGLNRDLGFTDEDRVENIRRVAEVAKLMADAGLIVLVSFISPFRAERRMARELMAPGEFVEVFVDTPLEECARRDPKGLYAKAFRGELVNFTGVDSPYEPPEQAEIRLETLDRASEDIAEQVCLWLEANGY